MWCVGNYWGGNSLTQWKIRRQCTARFGGFLFRLLSTLAIGLPPLRSDFPSPISSNLIHSLSYKNPVLLSSSAVLFQPSFPRPSFDFFSSLILLPLFFLFSHTLPCSNFPRHHRSIGFPSTCPVQCAMPVLTLRSIWYPFSFPVPPESVVSSFRVSYAMEVAI